MRLLRGAVACQNIEIGLSRACLDQKMRRILERILSCSLQPRPLDKHRGENESKLSRDTPRLDATRCLLGLNPESRLLSSVWYYRTEGTCPNPFNTDVHFA